MQHRWRLAAAAAAVALALVAPAPAQTPLPPVRLALLSQWAVGRHGAAGEELLAGLDRVVDAPVFAWQRGRIPRSALVGKPIRTLPAAEAAAVGGRGECAVAAVRPPAATAWTEVDLVPRPGDVDPVCVVEVGGELNTVFQVLARVFVRGPGGLEELPLARRAVFGRPGIPVIRVPFGRPVVVPAGVRFAGVPGLDLLVARSPIETIVDGAITPAGPADLSPIQGGEWREADRVLIRLPLATLRAGAPGLVLAWKDRVPQEQPDRRRPFDLFP